MVALAPSSPHESYAEPSPYAWLRSRASVPTTYAPACEPLYPFQEIFENRTSRARGLADSCDEVVERKFSICIEIWQVDLESCVWRVSFHKYGYVHGDPVQMIDPTGMFGVVGLLIGAGLQSLLPGPGDSIRGALESLVTAYSINLLWDVNWATNWSLADDMFTRLDDSWVLQAMARGAIEPYLEALRGLDISDDVVSLLGGGGSTQNDAFSASRPRPPVLPGTRVGPWRGMRERPVDGILTGDAGLL